MKKGIVLGMVILVIGMSFTGTTYSLSMSKSQMFTYDGNILYVGGNGSGNYTTIQSAIDDASDGDTVYVFSERYHENISISKSIILIGEDKATTIIDADFQGDVINISADNVTIVGFTLTDSQRSNYYGSGIRISSSDNINIFNNKIINNHYGLYMVNSSKNTIFENIIQFNPACGINLEMSFNNSIYNNNVINEGSILLYDSCNNEIRDNEVKNGYGGVYLDHSCNNSINNNFVSKIIWPAISVYFQSCNNNITGNTITNNGDYGIHLHSSYNTITENIITNNDRAGIAMRGSSNVISENIIINNHDAGGIHFNGSYNIIQKNTIMRNKEYGIYLFYDGSYNLISENTIEENLVGIRIYYSFNNSIIRNNFKNQEKNTDCPFSSTIWDDGNLGNYWSDYTGLDKDGDGIGDTPKSFELDSNKDRYPLMVPYGPNTSVTIATPREGYIYLRNIRLIPFSSTIVFGNIKIEASAANYMNNSIEIDKVEFYVDGRLRWIDKYAPYGWRWRLSSPFKHYHTVSVVVYDSSGYTSVDEQQLWRFF